MQGVEDLTGRSFQNIFHLGPQKKIQLHKISRIHNNSDRHNLSNRECKAVGTRTERSREEVVRKWRTHITLTTILENRTHTSSKLELTVNTNRNGNLFCLQRNNQKKFYSGLLSPTTTTSKHSWSMKDMLQLLQIADSTTSLEIPRFVCSTTTQ